MLLNMHGSCCRQNGVGISVGVVQAELGDIVYVELPEVGSEVKQGEQFGVIESVKVTWCKHYNSVTNTPCVLVLTARQSNLSSAMQAASDVNSPVSGEVTDVNSSLTDESSKVRVPGVDLCDLQSMTLSAHRFHVTSTMLYRSTRIHTAEAG